MRSAVNINKFGTTAITFTISSKNHKTSC